jgi:hypothetical protein
MNPIKLVPLSRPTPPALPLTGAALRSVQHADAVATAAWDAADAAKLALESWCNRDAHTAADIAAGLELSDACLRACRSVGKDGSLVPRWQASVCWAYRQWPALGGVEGDAERCPGCVAETYARTLRHAGATLPTGNAILTAQWWRDAAAMGC